jgi:hypothetical protein
LQLQYEAGKPKDSLHSSLHSRDCQGHEQGLQSSLTVTLSLIAQSHQKARQWPWVYISQATKLTNKNIIIINTVEMGRTQYKRLKYSVEHLHEP